MVKTRFSKNQNDALFVLAILETKGFSDLVPIVKIRDMISDSRGAVLDASNFRKGIHALYEKGCLEVKRSKDLSLLVKLTPTGRRQAAKVYQERTGSQLDIERSDDEQMTIFDVKE